MGKDNRIRYKNKKARRLPVDETKLNMGNTYSSPPEYYYDISFTCCDCHSEEIWSAEQQKWWYEDAGGYFFAGAVRCRTCREIQRERKRVARQQAGHKPKT